MGNDYNNILDNEKVPSYFYKLNYFDCKRGSLRIPELQIRHKRKRSYSSYGKLFSSSGNVDMISTMMVPQSISGEFWKPLYLSCIAGASTCLGAAIVFLFPSSDSSGTRGGTTNSVGDYRNIKNGQDQHEYHKQMTVSPEVMCFSLALAGSVMITVSAISIGPECLLEQSAGNDIVFISGSDLVARVVAFVLGCLLYFGLSWFAFPEPDELVLNYQQEKKYNQQYNYNPNHDAGTENNFIMCFEGKDMISTAAVSAKKMNDGTIGLDKTTKERMKAWRVAMLLFVSLLCHNFPEGLAVAASALSSDKLGVAVTIGIMIHNIPEGIAIAVPCLAARPDQPWLAFGLASFSGLAEPLGALATLLILRSSEAGSQSPFQQQDASSSLEDVPLLFDMQNVLAFVAGVMIMVAVNELLPEGRRQISDEKSPIVFYLGLLVGFVIMSVTELYLQ